VGAHLQTARPDARVLSTSARAAPEARARRLRPTVTERFRLDEAPRVHRLMVDRKLSGRVVLLP